MAGAGAAASAICEDQPARRLAAARTDQRDLLNAARRLSLAHTANAHSLSGDWCSAIEQRQLKVVGYMSIPPPPPLSDPIAGAKVHPACIPSCFGMVQPTSTSRAASTTALIMSVSPATAL